MAEAPKSKGAVWGPDDSIFFSSAEGHRLSLVPATGGEPQQITGGTQQYAWPHLLPGGEALLVSGLSGARVISLQTGEEKVVLQLSTGFPGESTAKYVATGHLVYARPGGLEAVPFDLDRLEVSGSPIPILEGVQVFVPVKASST